MILNDPNSVPRMQSCIKEESHRKQKSHGTITHESAAAREEEHAACTMRKRKDAAHICYTTHGCRPVRAGKRNSRRSCPKQNGPSLFKEGLKRIKRPASLENYKGRRKANFWPDSRRPQGLMAKETFCQGRLRKPAA